MQPFPGLFVNKDKLGMTAFGGKVIILVNGIERDIRYILSIQPKNIAKINYYTTIPVKHQGKDASAVMDIILKEPNDGGSFYIQSVSAVNTGFFDAPIGATYNQGKSEFSLQYNGSYRNYHNPYRNRSESYIGDDFHVDIKALNNKEPFHYFTHNLQSDYTYRPDKSQALILSAYLTVYNQNRFTGGEVFDTYQGDYYRSSKTRTQRIAPTFAAFYQKDWDNGRQFETLVQTGYSTMDYSRTMTDSIFDNHQVLEYPSIVNTEFKSISASLFYQQPLNEKNHIMFRATSSYDDTRNNYILNNFVAKGKRYHLIAYGAWTSKFNKASLSTRVGLNLKSFDDNVHTWSKTFVNATTSFSMPIGKGFTFTATGDLSPIVPTLSMLTENEQVYDGYLHINGNPNLKTGYHIDMQQRLWWSCKHVWVNAFVHEIKRYQPSYQEVTYKGDGKFISRYENAEYTWRIAPTLTFGVREIFDGHFSARVALSYNYFYAKLHNGDVNEHTSLYAMLNLYGYFGKWTVSFGIVKPTKVLYINQISNDQNWDEFSISYKVNNRLHLNASCMLLFSSHGWYSKSENLSAINPGSQAFNIPDNKGMITVGLRYDVNFGRIFGKVKRSTNTSTPNPDVRHVQ